MIDNDWSAIESLTDDTRNLAVYPECAVIQAKVSRYECCDEAVKSTAGRKFCYNEVTYPEKTFIECSEGDVVQKFTCCDDIAEGDQSYAYECKL